MKLTTQHSISTTVVSCGVVIEHTTLLVEYSDGTLRQYSLQGVPARNSFLNERALMYKTVDQVAHEVRGYNADCRLAQNDLLRMDKERRLGWDYRARGYA